jgi:predicted RNA-binding Zn-ribbon protein involved in translation (DUF1610 family)
MKDENIQEPPAGQHRIIIHRKEASIKFQHSQTHYTCPYCGAGIPRTITGDRDGRCPELGCGMLSWEPLPEHDYNYHTAKDEHIYEDE